MLESVIVTLLLFLTAYYLYFLFRIRQGLRHVRSSPGTRKEYSVTVIIAVRNEEAVLEDVIRSVLEQDYPRNLYELVIVDDASDDRTLEKARNVAANHPQLKIIGMPSHASDVGGRKPLAIAEGVTAASGEIILTTDADCSMGKDWIRSMLGHFDPDVTFVSGPVLEEGGEGLFSEISKVEFLGLIATAAGLIGIKNPIICNGANIAYRKSAFLQAGGYGDESHFSDDEVLMQRIARRKLGTIRFCADPGATVRTKSPRTFREFWSQRVRWASKRNHFEGGSILLQLVVLYAFFFVLFLSALAAFVLPFLALIVPVILLAKVAFDAKTLLEGARLFKSRFSFPHFMIAEVFHVPYIVFAAFLGQFASLRWKGKSIRP